MAIDRKGTTLLQENCSLQAGLRPNLITRQAILLALTSRQSRSYSPSGSRRYIGDSAKPISP